MSDDLDRMLASLSPEARRALRDKLGGPEPLDATRVNGEDLPDLEPDEPTSETWDGEGDGVEGTAATAAPVATFDSEDDTTSRTESDDDLPASRSMAATRVDRGPEPVADARAPSRAPSAPRSAGPPEDGPTLTRAPEDGGSPASRYAELAVLGEGGMGVVLRVRDTELNRTVAMKVLRPKLVKSPRALTRFREEAQIAAQLQHPGIIPVHDIGRRPDGSVYFTMKEVKGQTFEDVIDEVQIALEDGRGRSEAGWSFRRLIDTFHRVCETVAYAHHRGVVHRDLKPENIMVGGFGEVLVLDWGLAKVLAEEQAEGDDGIVTDRSLSDESVRTRAGAVAGTPSYMAPEQARGQIHKIDPTTDVYGLGGILYAILAGRTPYQAASVRAMLDLVSEGEPITPPHRLEKTPGPVPVELSEIAMKALSHKQRDRYQDAGELAAEVATWLDGARKREKALEVVGEARDAARAIPELVARAGALEAEAVALLGALPKDAPEQARWPAWEKQAAARDAREKAERTELEVLQTLRNALSHAPDLPEAHDALADRFHVAHVEAEKAGNLALARQLELELRAHDRGRHRKYLVGDGAVTLVTDPPGARVKLFRYEERHKQLVPVFVEDLGQTPIVERSLARGSWVLQVSAPGHHDVTYPVFIERLQHWDGVAPGDSAPTAIRLPRRGELEPDDCFVPAGWFWSGGELEVLQHPLPWRRLWCDGVVFKRFPTTVQQVLDCANDLLARGREEEALRVVPRENGQNDDGQIIFGRDGEGRFVLVPDKDGDLWDPRYPVLMVNVPAATTYCAWLAERTGRSWRLPHELEWQKAARGVDGRVFPWGDHAEPSLASVARRLPDPIGEFPSDVSPYGLRGCAGGVQDLTFDPFPRGSPVRDQRVVRQVGPPEELVVSCGGDWNASLKMAMVPHRKRVWPRMRYAEVGFRPSRSET